MRRLMDWLFHRKSAPPTSAVCETSEKERNADEKENEAERRISALEELARQVKRDRSEKGDASRPHVTRRTT